MLKEPRNLLWIVPLAVLLTMPLWKPFAANLLRPERRGETTAAVPPFSGRQPLTASEMQGVRFEQSRNGTKEWLITADRLNSKEGDPNLQLEVVRGIFFGTAGDAALTHIRSQRAKYNDESREITLQGSVVIENDKGYEMWTESLKYLPAAKKIRSTAAVRIRGSNIDVRGDKLFYDTAKRDYLLEGHVVCKIW